MGTTTFTGPIKAGDVLDTTGTSVGDLKNVGFVVMAQSEAITQAASTGQAAGVYKTNIVIPANSQIVSISVIKTVAWTGAAKTINVGTNSTATQFAVAADNDLSTTVGVQAIVCGDDATRAAKWVDVGTSDVQIWVKSTNTGDGVGVLTVTYVQAINLTA
jgi:hypothetical protein